jgi:PQ loop repeat
MKLSNLNKNIFNFYILIMTTTEAKVLYGFMTQECYNSFLSFTIVESCVKSLISKTLSMGVLAGSLLFKLPQILNILKSASAEGISYGS